MERMEGKGNGGMRAFMNNDHIINCFSYGQLNLHIKGNLGAPIQVLASCYVKLIKYK